MIGFDSWKTYLRNPVKSAYKDTYGEKILQVCKNCQKLVSYNMLKLQIISALTKYCPIPCFGKNFDLI